MRGAGSILSPSSEAGLTLIEMLIVLAIIGVAAGATTLGIGAATRAPSVETEARRLATRLQAAGDDAMLGDRTIAFTVEKHGYGFRDDRRRRQDRGAHRRRARLHRLPGGITMTLNVQPPVVLGVDGSGKPMSATIESGRSAGWSPMTA
jgi:general secretion pathway protein H